jgi:16S rRNA (guanine527-N7)-methyltransferase
VERTTLSCIEVSRETLEKLQAYEALVFQWTKRINLVGREEIAEFWQRHIIDSLQLLEFIPANSTTATDLGSGAGLPGLVLALATNLHMTLIEADQRKAAFLRAAAASLNLDVTILPQRIESADTQPAPLITARALAALPKLLDLAVPKLAQGGVCLFMKGQNAETELTMAQNQWQMKVERFASRTSPTATILRLSEIRRAPPEYKASLEP